MITVNNVTKKYGKGENEFTALKDITLTFKTGSTNAVVGKSGSGKSTLLHIITGLDHPTNGTVLDDKKNIFTAIDTDTWRGQNVGIVFQQFFLQPNDSVLENVSLPLKIQGVNKDKRTKLAADALDKVGLSDKAKSKSGELSGGQKQRVAIARALVGNPSILIADEPTGNLDSENGAIIENLLFDLNKKLGTTLVLVTHDEDLANRCQNVIRLRDGQLVMAADKKVAK